MSQSSKFASSAPSNPRAKPALLHKTSIFEKSGGIFSISFFTATLSVISKQSGRQFSPNSFVRSSSLLPLLPVIITFHPFLIKILAVSFPNPEVAPVIRIAVSYTHLTLPTNLSV